MNCIQYSSEMHKLDIIAEEEAYSGQLGTGRREFCVHFIQRKKQNYRRIQESIGESIRSNGEIATCHKGCSVCCVLYVEAAIQECESIVYYLYKNPDTMAVFLERYDAWRIRMRSLGNTFARCVEILHENVADEISPSDQATLMQAMSQYQEQDLSCPFLCEGSCSIYEVRPYVCVNHYATTPEEWCSASNWCNPLFPHRPKVYMTEIDDLLYDRSFYNGNLIRPAVGFMPTSVYRILTEGLEYVAQRAGFDDSPVSSKLTSSHEDRGSEGKDEIRF